MATLDQIANTIDKLQGDMSFRRVRDKALDYLEHGRRANHEFIVRTNMRTLRSGPNRGKVRVDGAVVVMFGNKRRDNVLSEIVRKGENLLSVLDTFAMALNSIEQ